LTLYFRKYIPLA